MANKKLLLLPMLLIAACGKGTKDTPPSVVTNADSVTKDSTAKVAAVARSARAPHHAFDTAAAAGSRPLERETYQ